LDITLRSVAAAWRLVTYFATLFGDEPPRRPARDGSIAVRMTARFMLWLPSARREVVKGLNYSASLQETKLTNRRNGVRCRLAIVSAC
jgi:hypothetical protein